jgi:hypothetical protein
MQATIRATSWQIPSAVRIHRARPLIGDNLALPFETEVLGIPVTVEGIDISAPEEIVAICRRGTKRQKIGMLHLPLPKAVPAGAEWIEAYRRWTRHG